MPTKVLKIDPYLTVDGIPVPISAFSIILLENNIPTIKCVIDYMHSFMDPIEATALDSLDPLMENYEKFKEKVNKEAMCNFNVTVEEDGKTTQQLEVSNWILENVGIEETSPGKTSGIVVTFKHPLSKLEKSTLRVDGLLSILDTDYANGSDVLAAYIWGIDNYKEQLQQATIPNKILSDLRTDVVTGLDKGKELLEKQLKYGNATPTGFIGPPLPPRDIDKLDEVCKSYIYAWLTYLIVESGEDNLWSLLINNIVPGYLLKLQPSEKLNDPMFLSPADYWEQPIELKPEETQSILAPPISYDKVVQVYYAYCTLIPVSASEELGDDEVLKDEHAIAAIYPIKKPEGPGLTKFVGLPAYYAAMSQEAATYEINGPPSDKENSNTTGTASEEHKVEEPEDYHFGEEFLKHLQDAYLPALLQKLYMIDSTIAVRHKLNLGNESTPVPGRAYNIGKMRFYCTSIVHTVDIGSQTAVTEYSGTHCTITQGGEDEVTKSGTKSKLYTGS